MSFTPQPVIAVVTIVALLGFLTVAVWQLGRLSEKNDRASEIFIQLLKPTSLVSMLILLGVLFLLCMAILDLDKGGVLVGMGKTPFARGLITYLFAIVTIGTAVVLVLFALNEREDADGKRFQNGKDVLGLLLGVFGTIVGFYFASELSDEGRGRLTASSVLPSSMEVEQGASLTITVAVQGGTPPYRFALALAGDLPDEYPKLARPDGWIIEEVMVPADTEARIQPLRVGIQDASGEETVAQTLIAVRSRSPAQ